MMKQNMKTTQHFLPFPCTCRCSNVLIEKSVNVQKYESKRVVSISKSNCVIAVISYRKGRTLHLLLLSSMCICTQQPMLRKGTDVTEVRTGQSIVVLLFVSSLFFIFHFVSCDLFTWPHNWKFTEQQILRRRSMETLKWQMTVLKGKVKLLRWCSYWFNY